MRWRIDGFIWLEWVIEKLAEKHHVEPQEAEDVFFDALCKVRKASSGKYLLYGQSSSGRYLFIVFAWKSQQVQVISARDMTAAERRYYGQK